LDRLAVYTGTRNIYHDMLVSAKSLLFHDGADRVVFLIEDDTFPEELPDCITTMNVSGQTYFPQDGPNFKSRWTYMVMMRTVLTKLFPDADTILSLDHDTIVRKPIDLLWCLNLTGTKYYFAAVEEKQITHREHPYYNFGVVLHNLAKLRDGMDDAIVNAINRTYFPYCEQDAVNSYCKHSILELPQEYNATDINKYTVPEENVVIRHYAARNSKLRTYDDYKYYEQLPWRNVLTHTDPHILRTRHDVINAFIADRGYHSFLEIGTDTGISIQRVKADNITSVDPDTSTPATVHMTSDDFFASCTDRYDIIFVDGLHECNQVYRDIRNALSHLNPGGAIVLHDCLPSTERMQQHADHYPGGEWTGDVWKAFVKARSELLHLMYTIDIDYGCGIIDTTQKDRPDTNLPDNMETMTYADYTSHRNEWMNVKEGIVYE
jgi:lipopolysaccharide biosynthesis glycosyltransferase